MAFQVRDRAWKELSRHIGAGRTSDDGRMVLTIEQRGGTGLLWSLTVANHACRAWCDEESWCRWIAPLLPVPSLAQIDKMLLAPLADWSWLPLIERLAEGEGIEEIAVSAPTSGAMASDWEVVLTFVRDETQLSLRLVNWPAQWLIERSANWQAVAAAPLPPVAIAVVAGWAILPHRLLGEIQPGEGLLLSGTVDLTRGIAWLFQMRPLAKVRFSTTNSAEIEATMTERGEWPPEAGDADDIMVTVVAEIGYLMLPLERLTTLAVGEILQSESLFDGEVRLKINGRYLGSGHLIEVGGRWVVRVDRWFHQPLATVLSTAELVSSETSVGKRPSVIGSAAEAEVVEHALASETPVEASLSPESSGESTTRNTTPATSGEEGERGDVVASSKDLDSSCEEATIATSADFTTGGEGEAAIAVLVKESNGSCEEATTATPADFTVDEGGWEEEVVVPLEDNDGSRESVAMVTLADFTTGEGQVESVRSSKSADKGITLATSPDPASEVTVEKRPRRRRTRKQPAALTVKSIEDTGAPPTTSGEDIGAALNSMAAALGGERDPAQDKSQQQSLKQEE